MTSPLVSAIIPTYNRSGTIARAIRSVLKQSYPSIEILVVDDGSTDNTKEVLQPFGESIRVLEQSNAGPSAARNRGLAAARGEFVAFLDSDDEWMPSKIARQIDLFSQDIVCCVCNTELTGGKDHGETSFSMAGLHTRTGRWLNPSQVLATRFLLFNQVMMARKEILLQVGGFANHLWLLEDYDLALRLSLLGSWGIVSEPLVRKDDDTGGLGVQGMKHHQRRLRAHDDVLSSFLLNPLLTDNRTRRLAQQTLRLVRREAVAWQWTEHKSLAGRVLGCCQLRTLRLQRAVRRRMPSWPEPEVVAY